MKQRYPKQGKILNMNTVIKHSISMQAKRSHNLSSHIQSRVIDPTGKISSLTPTQMGKMNSQIQGIKSYSKEMQISEDLMRDQGIKLKINIARSNDNLFSLNMDRYLTNQLSID